MRKRDGGDFSPRIDVRLDTNTVTVSDNGIGMTAEELEKNYWFAGNSGKNSQDAREAGVVGTFGIGAMANFGVAERLEVETESAASGDRSRSSVAKEDLSINQECIDLVPLASKGEPGTTVTALLTPDGQMDVETARGYISDFVSLLDVPVYVNESKESGRSAEEIVPLPPGSKRGSSHERAGRLGANVDLAVGQNGSVWVQLDSITWSDQEMRGSMTLRSDMPGLRTYRNGFGLATVGVMSAYQFGGVVNLMELYPTAGREALTLTSMQLLQSMLTEVDKIVSWLLSGKPECDSSTAFMNWVVSNARYDLCDRLRIGTDDEEYIELGAVRADTEREYRTYAGTDKSLISQLSNNESPLLLIARYNPRRDCQREYLTRFCGDHVSEISDEPQVTVVLPGRDHNRSEYAILFRIQSILEKDYHLSSEVRFGHISHRVPVFVEKTEESIVITVERELSAVEIMARLYENEYSAFDGMVVDFVRGIIFPRISPYVPSSQTHGTQAFLQMLRRRREPFEYERDDIQEFPDLAFWDDVRNDRISVAEAIRRTMAISRRDVQVLDSGSAASMGDVLPDVAANQVVLRNDSKDEEFEQHALPAIIRTDVSCSAKLLTIPDTQPALAGYKCFLALGRKAKEDRAEFFLQPHTTSIVWGGQRVLFIFAHRSVVYGLYYDIESRTLISEEPGGGRYPTCTIFVANQVYIPIPATIQTAFLPKTGERKRFLVRDDLLSVRPGTGDGTATPRAT